MNNAFNVQPQPQPQFRKSKKLFTKQFASSFRIESQDMPFVVAAAGGGIYLGISDPMLLITILLSFLVAGSLYFISACLPLVSKKLDFRLSIWHVLAIGFGLTLAFNAWNPSHALFLSGLQQGVKDMLPAGSGVEDAQVDTLFSFIKVALILVALGGGFAAWQQQQQGQSMTPIIMFVGGLFGIVLAIDIITAVVLAT